MTLIKGILFYLCLTVVMLFFCGGFASIVWVCSTVVSSVILYCLATNSTKTEFDKFTGITYIKNKTGIDLSEE